jgi:hypothetical protein
MTNEASEREAFETWLRREYPLSWALMTAHETALMRDAWKGARAAAPAVHAPVAWLAEDNTGYRGLTFIDPQTAEGACDGFTITPLYAAAPTAAQPNTDGVLAPHPARLDMSALKQWLVDVSQNKANTPAQQNAAWLLLQTATDGVALDHEGEQT